MSASNTTQGRKVPVQFNPPMEDLDAAKKDAEDSQRFAVAMWEIKIRGVISNLGSTHEISPAIFALTQIAREMNAQVEGRHQ